MIPQDRHPSSTHLAIEKKLPDWMRRFVVIDVETTGLKPENDRITELGVALFVNGRLESSKGFFVNPEGRKVSARITEITGITQDQVDAAPPFWHAYNEVAPMLYGATPVAYNRSFDRRFFGTAVARSWPRSQFGILPPLLDPNLPWMDPLPLARQTIRRDLEQVQGTSRPSFKLAEVASAFFPQADFSQMHRADQDAIVAGHVLLSLFEKLWDQIDWSAQATLERLRYGDYFKELRNFIRKHGRVPDGERFQCYSCDVCSKLKYGVWDGKRWTMPSQWYMHGGRTLCSSSCHMIAQWGEG